MSLRLGRVAIAATPLDVETVGRVAGPSGAVAKLKLGLPQLLRLLRLLRRPLLQVPPRPALLALPLQPARHLGLELPLPPLSLHDARTAATRSCWLARLCLRLCLPGAPRSCIPTLTLRLRVRLASCLRRCLRRPLLCRPRRPQGFLRSLRRGRSARDGYRLAVARVVAVTVSYSKLPSRPRACAGSERAGGRRRTPS